MKHTLRFSLLIALSLVATACTAPTSTSDSTLHVSGTAAFDKPVSRAQALQNGEVVSETKVATDGTFGFDLPKGNAYQLRFVYDGGQATLIFPRQSGKLDTTFDVTSAGSFDLGRVRHVSDPASRTFHFATASTTNVAALQPASGTDGNAECENGVAPDGSVCVDDGAENEQCGGDEQNNEQTGQHEDATDGAQTDGEATSETNDGETADAAEAETTGAQSDAAEPGEQVADAAVAEHNLPSGASCGNDTDQHDCQDGVDPATGQPCDGGPAANQNDGTE